MKCRVLCVCLSVSVSVSVWEGGDSWLREVTGKHGIKFLPFGGPPGRLLNFSSGIIGKRPFRPNLGREDFTGQVTGGHGRLR